MSALISAVNEHGMHWPILTFPIGQLWLVDLEYIDGPATVASRKDNLRIHTYLSSYPTVVSLFLQTWLPCTHFCQCLMTASVESMIVPL
jgi:hypothetical protein